MRLAILFLAVWCGGIAGQTFSNYPIPTASSNSQAMVSGSDGALWFVEEGSNKIGRITTSGVVTEYPIPTSGAAAFYITSGPDQALWFTECAGNKIGRITTGGVFSEYPIPSSGSCPLGITTGSDGALWFAGGSNMIGRITTSGTITTFSTSTQTNPNDITSGPDSALWFTEGWVSQIGRITTSGTITEYPVSSASGNPSLNNIVSGSDGALWFTLGSSSNIGRITTTGTVTLFPLLSSGNYGNFIIPAPDGSLYFTMSCFANSIGRITTSGSVSQDPIPSPSGVNVCGQGIILGPDNALWFTADSSQIWRMSKRFGVGGVLLFCSGSCFCFVQRFRHRLSMAVGALGVPATSIVLNPGNAIIHHPLAPALRALVQAHSRASEDRAAEVWFQLTPPVVSFLFVRSLLLYWRRW